MRERERELHFSARRADIFINISCKGAKFFYFLFFCLINHGTKFQDITIFKVFFIYRYTSLSFFTEIVTF